MPLESTILTIHFNETDLNGTHYYMIDSSGKTIICMLDVIYVCISLLIFVFNQKARRMNPFLAGKVDFLYDICIYVEEEKAIFIKKSEKKKKNKAEKVRKYLWFLIKRYEILLPIYYGI